MPSDNRRRKAQLPTDAYESAHQRALFDWAELAVKRWSALEMLVAIPMGGKRDKVTAAKLKAEGVRAGYLDLALNVPRGGFAGLFIEMKREDGGRTSAEQKWWIERLQFYGNKAVVCHGWEAAKAELEAYLALD